MPESVSTLLKNVCGTVGEGPHWDTAMQSLYFVSIVDASIYNWNYGTQKLESRCFSQEGHNVSFLIPRKRHNNGGYSLLAGLDQKIIDFHMNEEGFQVLHEVDNGFPTRFNDAKCDPAGRLLAGTMSLESSPGVVKQPGAGSLYGLKSENQLQVIDRGFDISNGLAWTSDSSNFFFIDSVPRMIYGYDYDSENFSASNRRVVIDFNKWSKEDIGLPDGMCIDACGHIWVACFFAGKVVCFDVNTGQRLREVKMPAKCITSCCFGGPQLDELFVTSSQYGLSTEQLQQQAEAGSVFKVTNLGVKGLPAAHFCG